MPAWLSGIELTSVAVVVTAAVVALVVVLFAAATTRRTRLIVALVAAIPGAAVGLAVAWVTTVPLNLFDVGLSPQEFAWIGGAFAAAGVSIVAVIQGRARRRVAGAVALVLSLAAGAIGVNAEFGQYTTVGSLFNVPIAGKLNRSVAERQAANAPGDRTLSAAMLARAAEPLWNTKTIHGEPRQGQVRSVVIPATVSGFHARPAYVYLPPVALTQDPPRLPVMIFMSGQPGSPENVMQAGDIPQIMDAFAAAHHGYAPIVVAPDQLETPNNNPMCVNSKLGDSATYLTVDVPAWIRTHLAVEPQPDAWVIAGFSQGATCSIQLGAAHPTIWHNIIDISGQVAPSVGTIGETVAEGFGGSNAAYHAALPEHILAENAPYNDMVAVFGSGSLDGEYGLGVSAMAAHAKAAGIQTTRVISMNTGHDWYTEQWVMKTSCATIWTHIGLVAP